MLVSTTHTVWLHTLGNLVTKWVLIMSTRGRGGNAV